VLKSRRLFTYGTLSPDHAPADVRHAMTQLHPIGQAALRGDLYQLDGYPGLIPNVDKEKVFGQLYALPADKKQAMRVLKQLDAYEEYDPASARKSLFKRKLCRPIVNGKPGALAWVYVYNRRPDDAQKLHVSKWSP
jgi:gamma-glutamylcyclotransferase (GGCT)/AIG2-like uncharacterized protein YtfP